MQLATSKHGCTKDLGTVWHSTTESVSNSHTIETISHMQGTAAHDASQEGAAGSREAKDS